MMFAAHVERTINAIRGTSSSDVDEWVNDVVESYLGARRIFVGGNGGSSAQASHFVAELVGAYNDRDRGPLSAVCLGQDPSVYSAISNDFGYEFCMARELQSHLMNGPGIFLGITTSGRSANVIRSVEAAGAAGCQSYVLCSRRGVSVPGARCLTVGGDDTPSIQEVHMAILHFLAGRIEGRS